MNYVRVGQMQGTRSPSIAHGGLQYDTAGLHNIRIALTIKLSIHTSVALTCSNCRFNV